MTDHFFKTLGDKANWQATLALLISLLLHLTVIYGVKAQSAKQGLVSNVVIHARLGQAVPPQERVIALDPSPSVNEASDQIKPEATEPASEPQRVVESTPGANSSLPVPGTQLKLPVIDVPQVDDPTYYPAKQVDVHPVAAYPVTPQYPEAAAAENIEGVVKLLLLVDESGVVREVSVVEANPEGYFEESAMDAFRNARFKPAQKNGRDVKSRLVIRVEYQAKDWKIEPGASLKPLK